MLHLFDLHAESGRLVIRRGDSKYHSIGIFLLIISLFASSCDSEQVLVPTYTQTPAKTLILTLTPTNYSTYTLERTLTPSPTATITNIPFTKGPHLSEFMLAPSDVIDPVEEDAHNAEYVQAFFSLYPGFYPPNLSVLDKSQELKSICLIECTWQIWSRGGYTIQITMIRSQDEQGASQIAGRLYNNLKPFDWEEQARNLELVNAPIQNTHAAFSYNRGEVLTTSRGSIAFHVVLYGSFGDNPGAAVFYEIAFTNLQINKLMRENVIP